MTHQPGLLAPAPRLPPRQQRAVELDVLAELLLQMLLLGRERPDEAVHRRVIELGQNRHLSRPHLAVSLLYPGDRALPSVEGGGDIVLAEASLEPGAPQASPEDSAPDDS